MMTKFHVCLLAMTVLTATASAQMKTTPLTGTWRMTEVKTTGPNAQTIRNPPGLLIFTGNHYSRMFVNSGQPRAASQDLTKATAAELVAVWTPFTAASGTYAISGSTLTCRPEVAKNPQVMAPGATDVYSFKIEGNTLTITDVQNGRGPVANPRTISYTRIE